MSDVIIFAGTVEGRLLTQYLADAGVSVHACVATEYGGSLFKNSENLTVSSERLGDDGMLALFQDDGASVVVDATHPYASVISKKIMERCESIGLEYIRLLRPSAASYDGMTVVPDIDGAVEYLKGTEGNILVTTGSKEIAKFTELDGFDKRVFTRVLSLPDVAAQCAELGFRGRNLICMQGPFNEHVNYGMMRQFDIKHIVTKDSGEPGGFAEKIRAARRAGVNVVLVDRPYEETGLSYEDATSLLSKRFGITEHDTDTGRTVYVIGVGMGNIDGMTAEAMDACSASDLVIGPKRVVELVGTCKETLVEFRPGPAIEYIRERPWHRTVAVVFSGDIGFHSGARKFMDAADKDWDVIPICGITSVQYICGKLKISWDDAYLMSMHDSPQNIIGAIDTHGKVFSLLAKGSDINDICGKLIHYGMDVEVHIGENMGSPGERIISGRPSELVNGVYENLSVVLVVNPSPDLSDPIGIQDDEFIRGDVPMTKSEVRSLTVAKLKLSEDSVIYDIGAGTGSVSIEMAKVATRGKVFAVEMNREGIELMESNKKKFRTDNLEIVEGRAPETLAPLPVPTHAFIGGSAGNMEEIIRHILKKNPAIRIVINSVTMETIAEAHRCIKELGLEEIETICVSISRSRTTDRIHLMMAQNPIYMITCRGVR